MKTATFPRATLAATVAVQAAKRASVLTPYDDTVAMQRSALEMWRKGSSWEEIGDKLHITPSKASKLCMRAVAKSQAMSAADEDLFRHLEATRLDEMQAAIYDKAIGKEPRVIETEFGTVIVTDPSKELIDTVLKISRERRLLFGLDKGNRSGAAASAPSNALTINLIDACVSGDPERVRTVTISPDQMEEDTVNLLAAPSDDTGSIPDAEAN